MKTLTLEDLTDTATVLQNAYAFECNNLDKVIKSGSQLLKSEMSACGTIYHTVKTVNTYVVKHTK